FDGPLGFITHALAGLPVYLAALGVFGAWFLYIYRPQLAKTLKTTLSLPYRILANKYWFDEFNQKVFADGGRTLANRLWRIGDVRLVDGMIVNGAAKTVALCSRVFRRMQTGFLY